jgi:hypothetical protein
VGAREKGDTLSRRDYVFYTGNVLAATVKGRYKRQWVGEQPGLSCAAFYDLYTDPREENPKLVPMLSAKGMFSFMKAPSRTVDAEVARRRLAATIHRPRKPAPGNQSGQPAAHGPLEAPV